MKLARFVFAALFALVPIAAKAQALPAPSPGQATLAVAGDATVEREPDVARVSVQIVTNDDNAARSTGKNADTLNALKAKLAPLGVSGDALRTTYFNVTDVPHPPKNLPPEQRQARYGYVTTRSLTISVAPIDRAGKVIDASVAAGVTEIAGVSFELKDRTAAYHAALGKALADAKSNAAALTAVGEFRIVRISSVSTGGSIGPVRPYPNFARVASMAQGAPTPTDIAPNGPIEVSAHVAVTYEIR